MLLMGPVLAFIGGFMASRLKLPPLVGYLLAGLAVGSFTRGFLGGGADVANQFAEIGILLMFGVGMRFDQGYDRRRPVDRRGSRQGTGVGIAVGIDGRAGGGEGAMGGAQPVKGTRSYFAQFCGRHLLDLKANPWGRGLFVSYCTVCGCEMVKLTGLVWQASGQRG